MEQSYTAGGFCLGKEILGDKNNVIIRYDRGTKSGRK